MFTINYNQTRLMIKTCFNITLIILSFFVKNLIKKREKFKKNDENLKTLSMYTCLLTIFDSFYVF